MKSGGIGTPRMLAAMLAIMAVAVSGFGCRARPGQVVADALARQCVVVAPAVGGDDGWSDWLARFMPGATRFPAGDFADAATRCRELDLVLVAPVSVMRDPAAAAAGAAHLEAGGRLLLLGRTSPGEDAPIAMGRDQFVYTCTTALVRVEGAAETIAIKNRLIASPFARERGYGGRFAPGWRWIPVAAALRPSGEVAGWPGSVLLEPRGDSGYSLGGWIGIDVQVEDAAAWLPLVEAVLEAMTRPAYQLQGGLERHAVRALTPLQVESRWFARRAETPPTVRLAAEWVSEKGVQVRRHVSPPMELSHERTLRLNAGLAPEPSGPSETFTLRMLLRDRNDQVTIDRLEQPVKVLSARREIPALERLGVNAGQLVQGRRPIFLMGVNYWPRQAGALLGTGAHWLDPGHFDARSVEADLDLMAAVGINAVALEYTDTAQAPQLMYVLDEMRSRSMWACLYMPSLHPMDVRTDVAGRLLDAVELSTWPEVFAIEVARGLAIKPRAEWRYLDSAWAAWVDEHFSSVMEAEQRLGIALWQERGRLTGPPDAQVQLGPHRQPAIALYIAFLNDHASRHLGYVRQWLRARGEQVMLTARSSFGWPGEAPPAGDLDTLDIASGALHQDFMFPDAWSLHPLRNMYSDSHLLYAHVRGVSGGAPVLWSAYGHHVGTMPDGHAYQRQKEVYQHYLGQFIDQGSSGAFAWWFPPVRERATGEDWGVVHPEGTWRPVQEAFRSARLRLRDLRLQPRAAIRRNGPLILSVAQWRSQQADRSGLFARAVSADVMEWWPPGSDLSSETLLDPRQTYRWTEIEGFFMLNAEWTAVSVGGVREDRPPGQRVRVYTDRPVEMELLNSGTVRWLQRNDRQTGSIWIRISQAGRPDEWLPVSALARGSRMSVTWTPRDAGLWEMQPYMIGYGKFGERLLVEATSPPRLF